MAEPEASFRLAYVVGRLDRLVRRRLGERLQARGLTLTAYTTLSVLRRRPDLSNAQLAHRSLVTPQAMNEILLALLDRGLVTRSAGAANGRALHARLTAAGRRLVDACERDAAQLEAEMLAGMDAEMRESVLRALYVCVGNLRGGL